MNHKKDTEQRRYIHQPTPYEKVLLRLWAEGTNVNNPADIRVAALASLASELRLYPNQLDLKYLELHDPSENKEQA